MRVVSHRPGIRKRLGSALLAGYPHVFAAPAFRALFLVLLLAGTASGMAMAYLAVWASERFGLGPQGVATLYVASGTVGAVGSPLLGLLSDRIGRRRPLVAGQLVVTAAMYVGYTQAAAYPVALVLVALSSFGIMGLVLAIVADLVRQLPEHLRHQQARILAAERSAWSIGIILGPAAAAAIVTVAGETRPVFAVAALIEIVAAILVWQAPEVIGRTPGDRNAADATAWNGMRRLLLGTLVLGLTLLMLPAQTRNMYLPLFVTQVLREAPGTVGPLFTLNAITAVLLMPHVGTLADRIGAQRVLYLSALVGLTYCTLQSIATTYAQTLPIQMLIGTAIAGWSTASLIYLQRLLPENAGVAGGLYLTGQQIAPIVSGLVLGPIAEIHGIPAAFATTALLTGISLALLVLIHRGLRQPMPAPRRVPTST